MRSPKATSLTLIPNFKIGVNLGLTTELPAGFETGLNYSTGGVFDVPELTGYVLPAKAGNGFVAEAGWGLELGGSLYLPNPVAPVDLDFAIGADMSAPTSSPDAVPAIGIAGSVKAGLAAEEPFIPVDVYGNITGSVSFSLYDIGEAAVDAIIELGKETVAKLRPLSNEAIDFITSQTAIVLDEISKVDDSVLTTIDLLRESAEDGLKRINKFSSNALSEVLQFRGQALYEIYNLDTSILNQIKALNSTTISEIRQFANINDLRNLNQTVINEVRGLTNNPVFNFLKTTGSETINNLRTYGNDIIRFLDFFGVSASALVAENEVNALGFKLPISLPDLPDLPKIPGLPDIPKLPDIPSFSTIVVQLGNLIKNSGLGVSGFRTIIGLSSETISTFINYSDGFLDKIQSIPNTVITQVKELGQNAFDTVKGLPDNALTAIASLSDSTLNELRGLSNGAFTTLNHLSIEAINAIRSFSQDALSAVLGTSRFVLDQIQDMGSDALSKVIGLGNELLKQLRGFGAELVNEISDLSNTGREILEMVKNGVDSGFDQLPTLLGEINGFLSNLPDKLLDLNSRFLDDFLAQLPELPADSIKNLEQLANKLINALPSDFQNIDVPSLGLPSDLADTLSGILPNDFATAFFDKLPDNFIAEFAKKLPSNFFEDFVNILNGFLDNTPDFIREFLQKDGGTLPNPLSISDLNGAEPGAIPDGVPEVLATGLADLAAQNRKPNSIGGTPTDDILIGDDTDNYIAGGSGNDKSYGNGGADQMFGGQGQDDMYGGRGNDSLYGDVDGQSSKPRFFEPTRTALPGFTPQNGGWSNAERYPRQVADVNGDGRADIIGFGEASVQVALGKQDGTFEPIKTATSQFTLQNGGWSSAEQYPRQVADVNGDGRADIIGFGEASVQVALGKLNDDDNLNGEAGDDLLVGGWGNDTLTGGPGRDIFRFNASYEGIDQIKDFSVLDDTIQVSASGFGGDLTVGAAITATQFALGSRAQDASDRFIYNRNNGALFFDKDGTGAIAQVQIATLSKNLGMTHNDIHVIA